MKLTFFLLISAIYFSYADRSNQLLLRNLDENDKNNLKERLIILGFGKFPESSEPDPKNFSFYLQKDNFPLTNISFSLPLKIELNNGTHYNITSNCSSSETIEHNCTIPFDNENITNITIINWENLTKSFNVSENQLIISPLANKTKLNIKDQNKSMDFEIFEFKYINIDKANIALNGKIKNISLSKTNRTDFELLILPNKTINCDLDFGENIDKISFSADGKMNEKIHLKFLNSSDSNETYEYIILILADENDYILYSTAKKSFIEFIGSANYKKLENKNATTQAIFKGTLDNFKKYIRFPVDIKYGNLRFLQSRPEKTNATGERYVIDLDSGIFVYNITFHNTENLTNVINFVPSGEFEFSENQDFKDSVKTTVIHRKEYNLTNKGEFDKDQFKEFTIKKNPSYSSSSFSFDINNFPLTDKKNFNITKNKTYLSYVSMEDSKLDEIECFIINKTSFYTIDCAPKKSVYTFLKTVEINIPYLETKRRLRFLDETNNITLFPPADNDYYIEFDYNPEINTFGKKYNKNKGLSPGAIVAIVFATVAAVAAVAVAIFFLNRMPSSPVKTQTEMNLQNSSANINK